MSGEKGKRGFSGAEGRKGDVGPLGARGMAGMKGEKGEGRIACGAVEFNWKQCVWTNYDQRDNGTVQTCNFKKKDSKTALRVVYSGVQAVYSSGSRCSRWYFAFNGRECTTPANIELIVHTFDNSSFRTRQMEGYCENISSGSVEVAVNVGRCHRWRSTTFDAYTGWIEGSPSRVIVAEVSPPQL